MRHPHGLRAAAGAGELQPGDPLGGGYFAGYISHTADGNATHGLIVAPAASGYNGQTKLQWKTNITDSPGTSSQFDGKANTDNMSDSLHPAANYCAGLTINNYSDWYLPARYELEIAYYNLKPTTDNNNTSYGTNPYSVTAGVSNYTNNPRIPDQTTVAAFQSGGTEAFVAGGHFSSTQYSANAVYFGRFNDGYLDVVNDKRAYHYVRAFRRFTL